MDELKQLESMHLVGPALSLYLPLEGDAVEEGFVKRWLGHLAQPGAGGKRAEADDGLQRELDRVEAVIRSLGSRAPAIAAFSCEAAGMIKVFELPEAISPLLVYSNRLETQPLHDLLGARPPALVAVVDKENGWLFEVWLDRVRELESFSGRPVHHHKQGQTLAATLQRRADQQTERNLRPLARAIDEIFREHPDGCRLFVAGPAEARSTLIAELGRTARAAVAGEAGVPAYLASGEMRRRVLELVQEAAQPAAGGALRRP